jgi:hypothetical protein
MLEDQEVPATLDLNATLADAQVVNVKDLQLTLPATPIQTALSTLSALLITTISLRFRHARLYMNQGKCVVTQIICLPIVCLALCVQK